MATGLAFRVSASRCERTIFTSSEANQAMRFWHDLSHVRFGLTFSSDDEMELGILHLEMLRSEGFEPNSWEFRLLHADTLGQTLCRVELGHFPADQRRFATTAAFHSIDAAIKEVASEEAGARITGQHGGAAA